MAQHLTMLDSYFPMAAQFARAAGGPFNSRMTTVAREPRKERAMQSRRVLAALRDAIAFQNSNPAEVARIGAEKNKLKSEMASYIISLYQFSLGIVPNTEIAAKTQETWMRSKERLKGDPIDWSKTIDRSCLDRAIAMR
jgi:ABC-type nitrate/sulfonate/bicarbonate transport system substrate-binding protein